MFDNVLFLSCHRDDECLSAGGTLLQCDNLHIHYFNDHHPLVDDEIYNAEAEKVRKALNCTTSYSNYMDVNELDTYPISVYVEEIEDLIVEYKPDTLILPFPSYNQDHRVIYEAALTASRVHDKNHFVENVLLAEQPETHTPVKPFLQFEPHLFVSINVELKLELYGLYRSQQRSHRSLSHIRSIAEFRGMQCHEMFAEAFMVVRAKWQSI